MSDTTARTGVAVVGSAIAGTSDMPDPSEDHFTWEGHCWEAVTDPDLLVATMDPSASPAAKEALTARLVQSMSVATKKLVVTDEAILNHATLIGQTVVDDINVQGKLVGTDGVFTGTVDFANVNVTGELLANEISGEHIYGTVLEGGEVRAGGGTTGDSVVLGDDTFHPSDGTAPRPGLMVAEGGVAYTRAPGIGVSAHGGVEVSGGTTPEGGNGYISSTPYGIFAYSNPGSNSRTGYRTLLGVDMDGTELLAQKDGEATVSIRASAPLVSGGQTLLPPRAIIQVSDSSGTSNIDVRAERAQLKSGSREVRVDASGVWVTTKKSGVTESWNLEETASDTGWKTFPMNSAIAGAGSPAYRIKSGTVFLRGSVTLPGANWSGGWTTIGALPAEATPTFIVQRTTVSSAMSQIPEAYLQVNTSGQFHVWIPRSVAGTTSIQLSPMSYVAG